MTGMTRREFLKMAGAFVILCSDGWNALPKLEEALGSMDSVVGPLLREELSIVPTLDGAHVWYSGRELFAVNQPGYKLLCRGAGRMTLDAIIGEEGMQENVKAVAMFFDTLGKAGYLQNAVEIKLFESVFEGIEETA